jgi:serine/threonine protein kinase
MLVAKSPFSDSRPAPTVAEMRAGHFIKSWFSPLMRNLLSLMLHFDPEKRIKLRELWDHPLVKKFSPHERLPGRPADILSGAVGIADVLEPLLGDDDEVDPETMRNLIGLHPGMEETHIYHQLRSKR